MSQFILVVLFIIFKLTYLVNSTINTDDSNVKCIITESGNVLDLDATWINKSNFTSITEGDVPTTTDFMPTKPKNPSIEVFPSNNKALVSWYSPTYGKAFVKHFLVKLEEVNYDMLYRYYLLVNVPKSGKSMSKFTCTYGLSEKSESLTSTVWAFGPIKMSKSGHMLADVDEESKSKTVSKKTNKEFIDTVDTAKKCVRANLTVKVAAFPSVFTYSVESNHLPNETKIKIQVLRVGAKQQGDTVELEKIFKYKQKLFGKFIINTTGYYYIRVHRLCNMYKDEVDVIRSLPIFVPSSSTSKLSMGETSVKPLAMRLEYKPLNKNSEVEKKILHLVFIIFGFGLVAIIQLAIIIKFCEGIAKTRVLKPRRVAIIFTKDTVAHVSRVYQLKSSLLRLGIDAMPYDETHVPGMRLNWIQVGENIATQSDVVVFIISPFLMDQCKPFVATPEDTSPADNSTSGIRGQLRQMDGHDEDGFDNDITNRKENIVLNSAPHNLPAVVINSLKVGNLSRSSGRPRVIHVYFTENKDTMKDVVNRMHREHPSLMSEDAVIHFTSEDNEINNSHIKKLAEKIKM
ncbi:hypothetical protein ACF0H5_014170 [Mactra antiquata]